MLRAAHSMINPGQFVLELILVVAALALSRSLAGRQHRRFVIGFAALAAAANRDARWRRPGMTLTHAAHRSHTRGGSLSRRERMAARISTFGVIALWAGRTNDLSGPRLVVQHGIPKMHVPAKFSIHVSACVRHTSDDDFVCHENRFAG